MPKRFCHNSPLALEKASMFKDIEEVALINRRVNILISLIIIVLGTLPDKYDTIHVNLINMYVTFLVPSKSV